MHKIVPQNYQCIRKEYGSKQEAKRDYPGNEYKAEIIDPAFLSLVLLFGAYAIIDGVLALVLASRRVQPRGAPIARGIASIAAGIIAFVWPGITAFALLIVIAAWAIVSGALELVMAIQMRRQLEGEWLLGLEGVLSIVF